MIAIKSEEELDQALAEMGRLKGELAVLATKANDEIEVVKKRYQLQAICNGSSGLMSIPDRLNELDAAAREFCLGNKDALIPDPKKKKSKTFTHGSIGFNAIKKSVKDTEDGQEARQTLVSGLITAVIALLAKTVLCGLKTLKADRVFNVKLEVNRSAVLDLHKKCQITDEHLATMGLKIEGGGESLWIEPAVVSVTPHTGEVNQATP